MKKRLLIQVLLLTGVFLLPGCQQYMINAPDPPQAESVINSPPTRPSETLVPKTDVVPIAPTSSDETPSNTQVPAPGNLAPKPVTPKPVPAPGTSKVTVQDFAFVPASLTIKVGSTVVWTNRDSVNHTVTSDNGLFGSGLLGNGKSYSYTFSTVGNFSYYCTPHPTMTGTITVIE